MTNFYVTTVFAENWRVANHEAFWDKGSDISFNPAGDGNCQFAAIAHALQDVGIYRSNETLRREVVQYLSDNPNASRAIRRNAMV